MCYIRLHIEGEMFRAGIQKASPKSADYLTPAVCQNTWRPRTMS
jgi:hypothetical protein